MRLKIKTTDIELEYTDECSMIDENPKKRLIEIIDKLYSYRIVHLDKPLPTVSAFARPSSGAISHQEGLTKREYFATHAEIPWNAVITTLEIKHPGANITVGEIIKYRAVLQVMAADALIEALNKQL